MIKKIFKRPYFREHVEPVYEKMYHFEEKGINLENEVSFSNEKYLFK